MEALGAVGSIIAIVQISEQVVSSCYQYFTTARDATEDILHVIDVVSGLKSILTNLQSLINTNAARQDTQLQLGSLNEPLKACKADLVKLETRLNIKIDRSIPKRARLMWPFKKEVEGILQGIEKHKTTFILTLSGDILQTSLAIKDDVSAVYMSIKSDQRYREIIAWLKLGDPSTNHNAARSKHEPSTGNWFLESDAHIGWIEGKIGSLWLHGIPGAGKTILCSTIIEHVRALCQADSTIQYAYFYFDFNDREKQTVVGMLRSIIVQLCSLRATIPPEIDRLYLQHKEGKEEPGREGLIEALLSLLKSSGHMFLIMDALDECSERGNLISVVARILQLEVSLLLTSRKEQDLSEGLEGIIEVIISLEGCGVDGDIGLHIEKRLESDRCLRKWPPSVKQEIKDVLVRGAHGMYISIINSTDGHLQVPMG
jgi:ankyrin repeat domain-containing protein 50